MDDELLDLIDGNLNGLTCIGLGGNLFTTNGLFKFGAAAAGKFKHIVTVNLGGSKTTRNGQQVDDFAEDLTERVAVEQCLTLLLRG